MFSKVVTYNPPNKGPEKHEGWAYCPHPYWATLVMMYYFCTAQCLVLRGAVLDYAHVDTLDGIL